MNYLAPTKTTGIAFGDSPPPHSPWLVSSFYDIVLDCVHLEKWAVKWRDLYPGARASHDEKHLWARRIARAHVNDPSVVTDPTRTHFPERALRKILFDSCPDIVRVQLVASHGGGQTCAIHPGMSSLGVIASKDISKGTKSELAIRDLLNEAGLPQSAVVQCTTPLDGNMASISVQLPLVVGMGVHFKDGDATVVAFHVINYGTPPSPLEAECNALKQAHSEINLDFVRYRERLIWYTRADEYRRVQRHIGGEGEAEYVRRAIVSGDANSRVMLCAIMNAELRYVQEEIEDPAAQVAALLALTIAARAALQRTVDTARVLGAVLAFWRDIVLLRDISKLGLGVPNCPTSASESRTVLVEMLQQTQGELKIVREDIKKFVAEDAFCEMILQRSDSSAVVPGSRRVSPPNLQVKKMSRKRGPGEKPAGRTPKDSTGIPMLWDEKGFWKSSSIPGEIKISNAKVVRV